MAKSKKYEFLEHPADIKIRSFGKSIHEALSNAALGMTEFLFGKEVFIKKATRVEMVKVEANDRETLLVDFLSKILFLSASQYRAFVQYEILRFDEKKIIAKVASCKAVAQDDIKGVTYNELEIAKRNGVWEVTVVYDT